MTGATTVEAVRTTVVPSMDVVMIVVGIAVTSVVMTAVAVPMVVRTSAVTTVPVVGVMIGVATTLVATIAAGTLTAKSA